MEIIIKILYLFSFGAILGWLMELIFRRLVEKDFNNFGFLSGPYLPIHGFGLLILYANNFFLENIFLKVIIFTLTVTLMELAVGVFFEKYYKVRLWDYRRRWLNFKGYICPLYSFYWFLLGAIFMIFLAEFFVTIIVYVSRHQWVNYMLGVFVGVVLIDIIFSFELLENFRRKIQSYNLKNKVRLVVSFQNIKDKLMSAIVSSKILRFLTQYVLIIIIRARQDFFARLNKYFNPPKNKKKKMKDFI